MFHTQINRITSKHVIDYHLPFLCQILVNFGILAKARNVILLSKVCGSWNDELIPLFIRRNNNFEIFVP